MTASAPLPDDDPPQHVVLHNVSWDFYERLLEEIGSSSIFVTFEHGSVEITKPLAEHQLEKIAIGRLLQQLTLELRLPIRSLGSTTFRDRDKEIGLEPDECYYLRNESKVRGMKKQFDPKLYPPPDLAIEVDVTHRSIPRLPIYAALGVPEVWRYDGRRINVLLLDSAGEYKPSAVSPNFPLVPLDQFQVFVDRMLGEEGQNSVIEEFRQWARGLPRGT